jgi:acetate kinase
VDAVGFKAVHAGSFRGAELLTPEVLRAMEEHLTVAPAHNRHYIDVISLFMKKYPGLPLVGLFEPHFHDSLPEEARVYGVPYEWFEKQGVQKYGFHGASHHYIRDRLLELAPGAGKAVSCHLGGSSSLCAMRDGRSIDTSFGLSLQSGILHSNRCGDIDAFMLPYLRERLGLSYEELFRELASNAGLKGISGMEGDLKEIEAAAEKGNPRAGLAVKKFVYDVLRYIGGYIVALGGLDALVFTGGIGENSVRVRREVCRGLAFLGLELDEALNGDPKGETRITKSSSAISAWVIPTNEELVVAREVEKALGNLSR